MAAGHYAVDPLLQDWVDRLQSGTPERLADLYDDHAVIDYDALHLHGRRELERVLAAQKSRFQGIGVVTVEVGDRDDDHLCFKALLQGRHGWFRIESEWTATGDRIQDHTIHVVARQRRPGAIAA